MFCFRRFRYSSFDSQIENKQHQLSEFEHQKETIDICIYVVYMYTLYFRCYSVHIFNHSMTYFTQVFQLSADMLFLQAEKALYLNIVFVTISIHDNAE